MIEKGEGENERTTANFSTAQNKWIYGERERKIFILTSISRTIFF